MKALLAIAATLTFAAPLQESALRLRPDPENVVASRLEGIWEPDPALGERLGSSAGSTLEFRADPAILERVPAKFFEPLGELQIFFAGILTQRRGESVSHRPMLLLSMHGNPHVISFRERDGDPMGDAESFNLAVIPAEQRANDLLFVGGDFNNQPFSAFKRAPK